MGRILYLTFIVLLGLTTKVFGENNRISQQLEPRDEVSPEAFVDNIISSAWEIRGMNPDSSLFLAQKAFHLSDSIDYKLGKGKALRIEGISKKNLGNFDQAIESYLLAIRVFNSLNDSVQISKVTNNIGAIYAINEEFEKAEIYFRKTLEFHKKRGNKLEEGKALLSVGNTLTARNKFQEALVLQKKALSIFRALKEDELTSMVLLNLGNSNEGLENFRIATKYVKESTEIREKLGLKNYLIGNYNTLGVLLHNQKRIQEAIPYYRKSLVLATEFKDLYMQQAVHKNLSNLYSLDENILKAFHHQSAFLEISEEIFGIEKANRIEELRAEYESEKQEAKIRELALSSRLSQFDADQSSLENQRLWMGMLFLLVLSALVYHFNRRNMLRHRDLLIEQREVLRLNGLLTDIQEEKSSLSEEVERFLRKEPNYAPLKKAFLSNEEEAIFLAIARDQSLEKVASDWEISDPDLKAYKKTIFQKMQIRSSQELKDLASRLNITK